MPLDTDDLAVITYLASKWPNRWKTRLRHAWETGNYHAVDPDGRLTSKLQLLRNTHGPSWLERFRLAKEQR